MIRSFTAMIVLLICVFLLLPTVYGQNKTKDRKDEQRENERVKKAEREVGESKRELAEIQKKLKDKLRSVDAKEDSVSKMLRAFREAEDEAEKEIGASIGIPSALTKVKEARAKLDEASQPVLEKLHGSAEWTKLTADVEAAKQKRDELNENADLNDAQRDAQLLELSRVFKKTSAAEEDAIRKDPACIPLQQSLQKAQDELESLRKKISRDKVSSHPKVIQASKKVEDAKKSLADEKKDAATLRANANKAIKKLSADQTELIKARNADKQDPNNGKPKGKGK